MIRQIAFWRFSPFCVLYIVKHLHLTGKNKMSDKSIKSCDAKLNCKATASLQEEVEEDLRKSDGSLKELLKNDETNDSQVKDS